MLKPQQNRDQLQMFSLEAAVAHQSIVRVVDAFVDSIDLAEFGFIIKGKIKNGAPAFRAADLLKLYYYGYLNRVRSSRRLERETLTNIEAIWLIRGARPGYKTIANFRKDNPKSLKKVFQNLNRFLIGQDLFDADTVAIDGAKFRAQNSKKNNYNEKKVEQHLSYIEKKTQEYLQQLDEIDDAEDEGEQELKMEIALKLDHLQQRNEKYQNLKKQIEVARENGQTQVSTSDPDARALPKKMNIVEVGYNIVTASEKKNCFITNFDVLNQNDAYALSPVALEAQKVLQNDEQNPLTVLADKGFDTGYELKICAQNNINTIVAPKKRLSNKVNKKFAKHAFVYQEDNDTYTCPQEEILTTNGKSYNKKTYGQHRAPYKFKRYTCSFNICKNCPCKLKCIGEPNLKNSKGRYIERSEYQPYIDDNIERYKVSKEIYRQRQTIVEHPFRTIKRQWGFDYTLLKTKVKVDAEFSIIFTAYNLRRAISIMGVSELISRLKELFCKIFDIRCFIAALNYFLKLLPSTQHTHQLSNS